MKKKIIVSFPHPNPQSVDPLQDQLYRVEKVQGSVVYDPHQFLTREVVRGLCENAVWTVIIIPVAQVRS